MVHYPELLRFLHHFLNGIDSWIAEFHHLVAVGTDQMVVLPVGKRLLILTYILSKLMPRYQKTVFQEFQRIVKRSPAYLIFTVLHGLMQRFHIKVPGAGINLLQNGETLGRFPKLPCFQVRPENLAYFFKNLRIEGHFQG